MGTYVGHSRITASAGAASSGGGGGAVVNHIYVNGTAEDVARKIADQILRTVMQAAKVGLA